MWPTPKTCFFSRSLLFRLQSPSAREESRWFTQEGAATSEGKTTVNNFGNLFSQWNVVSIIFIIQYLNNHNSNTLHMSDMGQVQFSSVAQSCPTLGDRMDCSTPGLPVHHQLPEFTQTHVHWVSDAIQPFHPLLSPSPALNISQYQGLFQWVSSSHQVAKGLEFQLQHRSIQWTPRIDFLYDGLVGSPCSPRDSQESFPTLQFKSINSSVLSFLCSPTLISIHDYWKNCSLD